MAQSFEPRKVLKQIANPLLREFFSRRGELLDVPWDRITEHKIEPVFEGWQALPERQRLEVQVILRDINELADHRGMAVLAEEIRGRAPGLAEQFKAQASKVDKAMWIYLHLPEAFSEATLFARADALAAGRHWKRRNGLPKVTLGVTPEMLSKLGAALTAYYAPKQMRGGCCKVVHYRRQGGSDYFFAYLDDYPDKHIVFDSDDDEPTVRSDRYAFENVFVYNGDDGSMEVFAQGGKPVWEPLQIAFCKAVLGRDVDPADPLRPTFKLDHLLNPDFPLALEASDGVVDARITQMRVAPRGSSGWVEIKADPKASANDIYRKFERWLRTENVTIAGAKVMSTHFALQFQQDRHGSTLRFYVSVPNTCNLKSMPDEKRVVGERCLRRWGVTDDQ
ncbi:MAG: hypothetical protein JJU33_09455 [Phycisphaerales bacterium]|nr:hypothetical protein [Phycisphaerales bacterium]